MNEMNEGGYRMPGRDLDGTAIRQEELRQNADTKRKLIEEREKTRREKASRSKEKWTDSGFQAFVGFSIGAICVSGVLGSCIYKDMKVGLVAPAPFCHETANIMSVHSPVRDCPEHTYMVLSRVNNEQVLVQCTCFPRLVPDGGL